MNGDDGVDGSFFGIDICHLMYLKYPPKEEADEKEGEMKYAGNKLFGFDILMKGTLEQRQQTSEI